MWWKIFHHSIMLLITGTWVWVSFIELAQGRNIRITETLSQAVCKLSKSFVQTNSMQPPLVSLDAHKELKGNPASCTQYRWCKSGCKGFSSVPCGSSNSGNGGGVGVVDDDDDDGGGIAVRSMAKKVAGMKMINGKPTDERDYPYVVNIRWEPIVLGKRRAKCAGSIINERWILTTAQCAIIPMRRRVGIPSHSPGLVSFGEQDFDNPDFGLDCSRENPFDVAEKYFVESVEVPSLAYINITIPAVGNPSYDIALLKVHKKMGTMGVKLAREEEHCKVKTNADYPGLDVIVGWGVNTKKGLRDPFNKAKVFVKQQLSTFNVTRVDDDACRNAIQNHSSFDVKYRYCAKAAPGSSRSAQGCTSDCGGPHIVTNYQALNQAPVPIAISYLCAVLSRPACELGRVSDRLEVLTQVIPHLEWIKETAGRIE